MTPFTLDGLPPHQRDPRQAPWGIFLAWSMGAGGEQAFHWFSTEQEALSFLSSLDDLFLDDVAGVPDGPGTKIERLAGGMRQLGDLPLTTINEAQSLLTIRWVGRFELLLDESSRFAREIRRDYQDHLENGIPEDWRDPGMISTFCEHLGNYVRRNPERRYVSPYSLTRSGSEQ